MHLEYKTDFFRRLEKIGVPAFNRRLIQRAGVVAVNFSKERFVQKNWLDRSREPWKQRAKKSKGSLMLKSGRLKRSIRKLTEGDSFIIIGTDVPYAKIHNEGGTIDKITNVRSHNRSRNNKTHPVKAYRRKMNITIAKRQFLGDSAVLGRRIERQLAKDIQDKIGKI